MDAARLAQRFLYSVFRRIPRWNTRLEAYACEHFDTLPAGLRVDRLYRLRRLERPHYYLGLVRAAQIADRLGLKRLSVLEFGVAEGNGVLYLQNLLTALSGTPLFQGKDIRIMGFDTFSGLPEVTDTRDGPSTWVAGDFPSDIQVLSSLIKPKQVSLIPGLFSDSIPQAADALREFPPLFLIVDCDLYTSTMSIFDQVFDFIPNLSYWYFDDVGLNHFSERTGERLALAEFNRKPGNPFCFTNDWMALYEPVPTHKAFTHLFYCVSDGYSQQVMASRKVDRLPLTPLKYGIFAEQRVKPRPERA